MRTMAFHAVATSNTRSRAASKAAALVPRSPPPMTYNGLLTCSLVASAEKVLPRMIPRIGHWVAHLVYECENSPTPGGPNRLITSPCPFPLMKSSNPSSLWWASTSDWRRSFLELGRTRLANASWFQSTSWIFSTLNSTELGGEWRG